MPLDSRPRSNRPAPLLALATLLLAGTDAAAQFQPFFPGQHHGGGRYGSTGPSNTNTNIGRDAPRLLGPSDVNTNASRDISNGFTNMGGYNPNTYPQGGFYPQNNSPQQPTDLYQGYAQQPAYQPSGGQRYQIPAGYENSPAGSAISYGGASYTIGYDGTMTANS